MVNQGTILGRIGKIETKTLTNGNKLTNASMVTSKKFLKNGVKEEKVTWHNVVMFSKLAEIAEKYVSVGDLLYVQGEMDNQKYKAQDGTERTKFVVIAHDIKLMPKSKEHKPEPKPQLHDDFHGNDDLPW